MSQPTDTRNVAYNASILMIAKGWSINRLAKASGISQTTLQRRLADKDGKIHATGEWQYNHVLYLADALDVTPDTLTGKRLRLGVMHADGAFVQTLTLRVYGEVDLVTGAAADDPRLLTERDTQLMNREVDRNRVGPAGIEPATTGPKTLLTALVSDENAKAA